ncbi:putative phage holin [Weissella oryzae SG25]|uniref:Putative phage holin n=1 Tax=Weissella oryzae (strain DSM 25784 / JCM 18191 / LMG 30913 / SG25) TaxID=1329250 RepID=A0A069CS64_WEIOS|nr:phage holin [Weissella oryzae]GAK30232.1 putative phage holin [Weissella oryzae SG25]GAK30562.1 putative phage holin [Weissella oryzae SG25]
MNKIEFASVATTVLTALATFYLAVAKIWNLPFGEEVSNTIYAVVAMIASILGGSTIGKISKRNQDKEKASE